VYSDFGAIEVEVFFNSFTDFVNHYLDDPRGTAAALPRNTKRVVDEVIRGARRDSEW
jgi:hypothetical protein